MTQPDERASVKVRRIEWEKGGDDKKPVWTPALGLWPCWIVLMESGKYLWCEEIGIEFAPASPVMGHYDTLEAAQAAVAADRERRILSAIDVTALKQEIERLRGVIDAYRAAVTSCLSAGGVLTDDPDETLWWNVLIAAQQKAAAVYPPARTIHSPETVE